MRRDARLRRKDQHVCSGEHHASGPLNPSRQDFSARHQNPDKPSKNTGTPEDSWKPKTGRISPQILPNIGFTPPIRACSTRRRSEVRVLYRPLRKSLQEKDLGTQDRPKELRFCLCLCRVVGLMALPSSCLSGGCGGEAVQNYRVSNSASACWIASSSLCVIGEVPVSLRQSVE